MNLLVISRNKNLFKEEDSAYKEFLTCSKQVDQIHIIVFTTRKDDLKTKIIDNKLFIYPTNSIHKTFYIKDAFRIAKEQTVIKFKSIIDLISGEDAYLSGLTASLIAKRYKRNFIINIYTNIFSPDIRDGFFKRAVKTDITNYVFNRAKGIRVLSQLVGEVVYSRNPKLQDRIYVLPFLSEIEKLQKLESTINIHKLYPNFNIIFVHVAKFIKFKTLLRLRNIMNLAAKRYPLAGLVVVGKVEKKFWHPWFYSHMPKNIVFEKYSSKVQSYYKTANVFLDTSSENYPGGDLSEAALIGCPIIASKTKASEDSVKDGENGFITDPRNPVTFFKKIIDILETPGLREAMHYAKFDITDSLYGRTNEEYFTRIVDIWNICKTPTELEQMPIKPAVTLKPYPVITMNVIKKVEDKVKKQKYVITQHKDDDTLNLDATAKSTIEEALAEIA